MLEFTQVENKEFKCAECKCNNIEFRVVESSCGGFSDIQYQCKDCGIYWWVESSDS